MWRCKEGDYSNRHRGAVVFHINAKRRHGDPKHNEGILLDHLEWVDEISGEVMKNQPKKKVSMATITKTENPLLATLVELIPQVHQIPSTPDIMAPFYAARLSGYKGSLGEWFALTGLEFWTSRNLNPYSIVASGMGGTAETQKVKEETHA